MVIQSSLILGIIEFRDVVGSIQTNSVENTEKATENRRARLESQMLQRWSRIYQREPDLTQTLEQFLEENRLTPEELNGSQTLQQEFLLKMFPVCQQVVQNSEATGCFLMMTGESPEKPGNVSGFYVRDYDPNTKTADNTDLSFARCGTLLSRNLDIALSSDWTTYFCLAGGREPAVGRILLRSLASRPGKSGGGNPEPGLLVRALLSGGQPGLRL